VGGGGGGVNRERDRDKEECRKARGWEKKKKLSGEETGQLCCLNTQM